MKQEITSQKIKNKKVIVYVDGFNLYYGLKHINDGKFKWLDLSALSRGFVSRHQSDIVVTKYFTALIKGNEDSRFRQRTYLQALQNNCTDLEFYYGFFLSKKRYCDHCGQSSFSYEEKKTDVNIACQLMEDAVNGRFDVAYVVSGDSDLVPPIEMVTNKGKLVIVAFPPNRKSKALERVASGTFNINANHLRKSQLPTIIQTSKGTIIKPHPW